jgi:hypothetical protein
LGDFHVAICTQLYFEKTVGIMNIQIASRDARCSLAMKFASAAKEFTNHGIKTAWTRRCWFAS